MPQFEVSPCSKPYLLLLHVPNAILYAIGHYALLEVNLDLGSAVKVHLLISGGDSIHLALFVVSYSSYKTLFDQRHSLLLHQIKLPVVKLDILAKALKAKYMLARSAHNGVRDGVVVA